MSPKVAARPRRRHAILLAVVALLVFSAVSSADAAPAYRGLSVHSLWNGASFAQIDRDLDVSKDLGANVLRVDVGWSNLETDGKGRMSQWYVNALDHFVNGADQRGIKVDLMLWSTPCWASSAPDSLKQNCTGSWWDRGVVYYPPTNPQDYADMARWVTNRYGTKLAGLEVWNEPNPSQNFWKSSDPAGDYVRLLKAAYPAAKAGNPDVPVLAGSLSQADVPFLNQLYDKGMKGSYDALAIHPYNEWRSPWDMWQDQWKQYTFLPGMRWVRQTQLAHGDTTPLWLTEYGWSSCSGDKVCVSPQQQAAYTAQSTQVLAGESYVRGYTIYDLSDEGTSATTVNDNYGIVDSNYKPKPVYAALKAAWAGQGVPDPAASTAAPSTQAGNSAPTSATGSRTSGPTKPTRRAVHLSVKRRGHYYVAVGKAPRASRVELSLVRCNTRCRHVALGRLKSALVDVGDSGRFRRRLGKIQTLRAVKVRARVVGARVTASAHLV